MTVHIRMESRSDLLRVLRRVSVLVVRRYDVIEQLEDVSHSEEELYCAVKNRTNYCIFNIY